MTARNGNIRGLPGLGVLLPLQRNALTFFTHALQRYDRVQTQVLGRRVLLLAYPDDLQQVLINDRDSYGRSVELRNLRPIFGNGLLTSDGDVWRRQRRLIQPKFSHAAMAGYARGMLRCMRDRVAGWNGGVRDLYPEMMGYTRDVICQALFGTNDSTDVHSVSEAVRVVFGELRTEILFLPQWRRLPLPRSMRWNRAVNTLNETITRVIAERRRSGKRHSDLLDVLLSARDDDGQGMDERQVHDEVLTIFLAGHETSALTLTWALGLLASNPEAQERAAAEAMFVSEGHEIRPEAYGSMNYINAVVQETMRLYPPVWSMGRSVERDTTVGDVPVSRGTHVWLCLYHTHRDARWWPEPERFQPERWMEGTPQKRHSFVPFGAGPRMCVGQHLATMEAVLGLAVLLRNYRVEPAGAQPEAEAWITLRPKDGMPLRLTRR